MKKGVYILVFLLVVSLAFAVEKTSEYGLPDNVARIADFDNDLQNEILTFSDRIDTRDAKIALYDYQTSFELLQNLTNKTLNQCALSYQDANQDGYLDIAFSCFNTTNSVEFYYFEYFPFNQTYNQSNKWQYNFSMQSNITTISFGDISFLDFTNDTYADIMSCFANTSKNITLFTYNKTTNIFDEEDSGITIPENASQINTCYLTPIDFDADGDFDIITYFYNENEFTLYENTNQNQRFHEVNDSVFNKSFFSDKKIKTISQFDKNSDGYPELYYVADVGEINGNRSIVFGYINNTHYYDTDTPTLQTPSVTITYIANNTEKINTSWETEGNFDYFLLNISNTSYNNGETNTLFYNLNITDWENQTLANPNQSESNYDYNSGYGNWLNRNESILHIQNQCLNIQAQYIAPNRQESIWSPVVQYQLQYNNTPIEFCDGVDNDCDGQVDQVFNFSWPDGNITEISFDNDNDGFYPQYPTFTHNNYTIVFNCTEKWELTSTSASQYFDPDDNNNRVRCSESSSYCNLDIVESSGGGRSSSGGSAGSFFTPETTPDDPPTTEESGVVEEAAQETEESPKQEEPKETQSSTSKRTYDDVFYETRDFTQQISFSTKNGKTYIEETVKNIKRTTQNELRVRKVFPKEVLESAYDLETINTIEIIEVDPVIDFIFKNVAYLEEVTISYSLPEELDGNALNDIQTEFIASQQNSEEEIEVLEAVLEENGQSIKTNLTEKIEDNKTTLTINLDLQENITSVKDVEVEQYIPKCLIEEITETMLQAGVNKDLLQSVEIKEADPLIVWKFSNVDQVKELNLQLDAIRPEDCTDEVKIRVLAQKIIKTNYEVNQENLTRSLLITAGIVIAFLLIFYISTRDHYYHEKKHIHKLTKLIARRVHHYQSYEQIRTDLKAQKETDEDIDEAIAHYKTRHINKIRHFLTEQSVEIFIFIALLILNTLDFTGTLPGYLDWIKKVISWMLLLFILYQVDITKVLFNNSKKWFNITLLTAMLLMHMKALIQFAENQSLEESTYFVFDLYKYILNHQFFISTVLFYIGAAILLILAVYAALKIEIKEGCLYYTLTSQPIAKTISKKIVRSLKIFVLLLFFFFSIFNRLMEWLALSIDAAIFVLALLLLLTMLFSTIILNIYNKKKKHISEIIFSSIAHHSSAIFIIGLLIMSIISPLLPEIAMRVASAVFTVALLINIIYVMTYSAKHHFQELKHISTAMDSLYVKFVKLFKYPTTLFLGISGLFLLQQIVEIGLFIVPNITGHETTLYSGVKGETLFTLFGRTSIVAHHLFSQTLSAKILYAIVYLFSIIGYFLLFAIPIYIWFIYFKNRNKHPSHVSFYDAFMRKHASHTAFSYVIYLLGMPTIIIALATDMLHVLPINIEKAALDIGVIIQAQKITLSLDQAIFVMISAFTLFIILLYGIRRPFLHKVFVYMTTVGAIICLGYYYYYPYFASLAEYISVLIISMIEGGYAGGVAGFILFLFILDIAIIYICGIAILFFFIIPRKVKHSIIRLLSHFGPTQRLLYLGHDMVHLDYYEDAKEHISHNMKEHLIHYVKEHEKEGYHIDMIIFQLKQHHYPQLLIDDVVKELGNDESFVALTEHAKPETLQLHNVHTLVPKVRNYFKKGYTPQQIYELFYTDFTYQEIHVALRLASQNTKEKITIAKIEKTEADELLPMVREIESLFAQGETEKRIREKLETKHRDLELLDLAIDAAKKHTLNMSRAKEAILFIEQIQSKEEFKEIFTKDFTLSEIAYALQYLHKKGKRKVVEQEIEITKTLISWVYRQIQAGKSRKDMITALKKAGWSDSVVTKIMQLEFDSEKSILEDIEHHHYLIKE